jgi:hypothetical protein
MTGFIGTTSQLQSIIVLSLIYPLHKSLGYAPFSSLYSQLHPGPILSTAPGPILLTALLVILETVAARTTQKTPSILVAYCYSHMFTVLLPSTGHGVDHTENTSSSVRIVVLPSN